MVGLAVTGSAAARHLTERGHRVVAVDDRPDDGTRRRAQELGIELVERPSQARWAELAAGADLVVVSPGVPAGHVALSLPVPTVSEVELAGRVARERALPMVAVTGTNGKTTVATLVARMLGASGRRAVAAGNIGTPLLEAVTGDAEVVVAEVSSFQLALTRRFRPEVGVWLNLAEDHLDWHPSLEHYVAAKSRIWANHDGGDVAVGNADDAVVCAHLPRGRSGSVVTFGMGAGPGAPGSGPRGSGPPDYHVAGGWLMGPSGQEIVAVEEMWRGLPHDVANGLAAAAAARAAGAALGACRSVLTGFEGLPHRVELVGQAGGVRWYDDSKSTTPASVMAALAGFPSVVLIAGGRNKGLDLGVLAGAARSLRAVVAIGEAAHEVEAALAPSGGARLGVARAATMEEAVALAGAAARPGDVVVLSPGCASFDWYPSYAERGRDFARLVGQHIAAQEALN